MEIRRIIIAVAISFLLLFGWQYFSQELGWTPKPAPAPTQTAGQSTEQQPGGQTATLGTPGSPGSADAQQPAGLQAGGEIVVDTPLYTAKFNSVGGILSSFMLKRYTVASEYKTEAPRANVQMIMPEAVPFAPMGVLINNQHTWRNGDWIYDVSGGGSDLKLDSGQNGNITFVGRLGNDITLRRVISFDAATYVLKESLEITTGTAQTVNLGYSISNANLAGPFDYMGSTRVARMQNGSFAEEDSASDLSNGMSFGSNIAWAGNMSNYFISAMMPADASMRMDARLQNSIYTIALKNDQVNLQPGFGAKSEVSYYFGPKQVDDLAAAPGDLTTSIDYGWFGAIAKVLMSMLKFFHSYVDNWGVAIIILTVLVKLVLWPLSYKSYKSMQGMKVVQPHIQKLREKYKDDKQRLNQEMMQLYKTYKINPMGGCLPIVVQLPIFFGLYKALLNAFELRQASFIPHLPGTDLVWLADLSIQDPLYITPIVMGATMFIQQKLTPTPGDPTQAKIMLFMPVIFTFLFLNFPSGLVLYWLVNNVISIAQQHWQLRRFGKTTNK